MVPILSHANEDGVWGIPLQIRKDIGRLPVGSAVDAVLSPGDIGNRQGSVRGGGQGGGGGVLGRLEDNQLARHGIQLLVAVLHAERDADVIFPGIHRRTRQDFPVEGVGNDRLADSGDGGNGICLGFAGVGDGACCKGRSLGVPLGCRYGHRKGLGRAVVSISGGGHADIHGVLRIRRQSVEGVVALPGNAVLTVLSAVHRSQDDAVVGGDRQFNKCGGGLSGLVDGVGDLCRRQLGVPICHGEGDRCGVLTGIYRGVHTGAILISGKGRAGVGDVAALNADWKRRDRHGGAGSVIGLGEVRHVGSGNLIHSEPDDGGCRYILLPRKLRDRTEIQSSFDGLHLCVTVIVRIGPHHRNIELLLVSASSCGHLDRGGQVQSIKCCAVLSGSLGGLFPNHCPGKDVDIQGDHLCELAAGGDDRDCLCSRGGGVKVGICAKAEGVCAVSSLKTGITQALAHINGDDDRIDPDIFIPLLGGCSFPEVSIRQDGADPVLAGGSGVLDGRIIGDKVSRPLDRNIHAIDVYHIILAGVKQTGAAICHIGERIACGDIYGGRQTGNDNGDAGIGNTLQFSNTAEVQGARDRLCVLRDIEPSSVPSYGDLEDLLSVMGFCGHGNRHGKHGCVKYGIICNLDRGGVLLSNDPGENDHRELAKSYCCTGRHLSENRRSAGFAGVKGAIARRGEVHAVSGRWRRVGVRGSAAQGNICRSISDIDITEGGINPETVADGLRSGICPDIACGQCIPNHIRSGGCRIFHLARLIVILRERGRVDVGGEVGGDSHANGVSTKGEFVPLTAHSVEQPSAIIGLALKTRRKRNRNTGRSSFRGCNLHRSRFRGFIVSIGGSLQPLINGVGCFWLQPSEDITVLPFAIIDLILDAVLGAGNGGYCNRI